MLAGPTACGKSEIACHLARRRGVPVVSADSMNLYRGMDIGTAKPSSGERAGISFYGMDVADPCEAFSVAQWLDTVRPAFHADGAPPVVAGGTGLYIKCLLLGLDNLPAADPDLRARAGSMSLQELQDEARRQAGPAAYERLADKANPRRLIRLIEQGRALSANGARGHEHQPLPVIAGLCAERGVLHARIARRVDAMYAGGLLDEAQALVHRDLSETARHAIGYAEAFAVLRGEMTPVQARERTIARTRQLAKRQMTWFRNQARVEWVDIGDGRDGDRVARDVLAVWERNGPARAAGVAG